jgi:heme A synthase
MVIAGVGLVIVAFGVCVASLLISRYQRGPLPDWVPVVMLLVVPFLLGAGVATIICSCFL